MKWLDNSEGREQSHRAVAFKELSILWMICMKKRNENETKNSKYSRSRAWYMGKGDFGFQIHFSDV
jgi:hypothetical protein